ncbi:hypothetical protein [Planomonospora venezuelensis]|uniref:Uncharacterized protein n=1 Tax=Planomonospora venezuelensis TaxID=1999 RepID=A0A841DCV6_PLAVE|nr:hypothetical protein [Planomonospora venezuelensis]MBB5966274.1 hypothetical protein [Planomonospora venezuelensis]
MRAVTAALAGALVAGAVVGAVARLLMSGVLLAADLPVSFSAGGTAAVLVAFAVLAVPAAATATARPAIRRAGRWATAAVTGWGSARTGLSDAKVLLLADESRLAVVAGVIAAFAVAVAAHGRLAQYAARRLAGPPATAGDPAGGDATGGDAAPLAATAPAS